PSLYRIARRRTVPGGGFATVVVLGAAAILVNGWIGGEVLVFHAGMGVKGGGLGANSPPLASKGAPSSFLDAMGRLRAHLAAADDDVSAMVVDRPRADRFRDARENALALGR